MRSIARPNRGLVTGILVATLVAAAGCGSGSSSAGNSASTPGQMMAPNLTAMFRQSLQRRDLSQFERDVLTRAVASGHISQHDYEEAHNRYARCIKDAGFVETYTKMPNGVYEVHPQIGGGQGTQATAAVDNYKSVSDKCARGTMPVIEALFLTQRNNPDLLADPHAVAVGCLVKAGLVPPSYTAESLKRDLEGDVSKAPFKASDPKAHNCLWSAGFAVAVGQ